MISFRPKKLRDLNRHLFAETTFDTFLVPEAHFVTAFRSDFSNPAPSSAAKEESGTSEDGPAVPAPCISWKELRPIALQLVRGTQAPKSFSVVLKLPDEKAASLLSSAGTGEDPSAVSGLYLNLRYAREELIVTTGCTLKTFSLDRTWEKVWDKWVEAFFEKIGLI